MEVMSNRELTDELVEYEKDRLKKTQEETNKKAELEALVVAIGRFEQLSVKEAWDIGLLRQYTSREISELLRELAYSMASVSSKTERRKEIEEFEHEVKALSESINEVIGEQETSIGEDALLYAKYLKRIF